MTLAELPTRKDEAFRYSDLEALAGLWPVAREEILVPSGQSTALSVVEQGESPVARHLVIEVEAGASFDLRILSAGRAFGRIAVEARLGEGASFTLGAAQLGGEGQTLEIVTEVSHEAPDAVSRQVVRSVLARQATGTYLGKVAVARGSDGTDAEQSVRAMLLDRTATANAKPELEIYADDGKCSHGSTSGAVDEDARFYLTSRGIDRRTAEELLVLAFLDEAIAEIEDPRLADDLRERLAAWLARRR